MRLSTKVGTHMPARQGSIDSSAAVCAHAAFNIGMYAASLSKEKQASMGKSARTAQAELVIAVYGTKEAEFPSHTSLFSFFSFLCWELQGCYVNSAGPRRLRLSGCSSHIHESLWGGGC